MPRARSWCWKGRPVMVKSAQPHLKRVTIEEGYVEEETVTLDDGTVKTFKTHYPRVIRFCDGRRLHQVPSMGYIHRNFPKTTCVVGGCSDLTMNPIANLCYTCNRQYATA